MPEFTAARVTPSMYPQCTIFTAPSSRLLQGGRLAVRLHGHRARASRSRRRGLRALDVRADRGPCEARSCPARTPPAPGFMVDMPRRRPRSRLYDSGPRLTPGRPPVPPEPGFMVDMPRRRPRSRLYDSGPRLTPGRPPAPPEPGCTVDMPAECPSRSRRRGLRALDVRADRRPCEARSCPARTPPAPGFMVDMPRRRPRSRLYDSGPRLTPGRPPAPPEPGCTVDMPAECPQSACR